jgi:hypothetical protein
MNHAVDLMYAARGILLEDDIYKGEKRFSMVYRNARWEHGHRNDCGYIAIEIQEEGRNIRPIAKMAGRASVPCLHARVIARM